MGEGTMIWVGLMVIAFAGMTFAKWICTLFTRHEARKEAGR